MKKDTRDAKRLDDYLSAVAQAMINSGEPLNRVEDVLASLRSQVEETVLELDIGYAEAVAALDPPDTFSAGIKTIDAPKVEPPLGPIALGAGVAGVIFGQSLSAIGQGGALSGVGDIITLVGIVAAIGMGAMSLHTRAGKAATLFGVVLLAFVVVLSFAEQSGANASAPPTEHHAQQSE